MSVVLFDTVAWGVVNAAGNLLFGRGATVSRFGAGLYDVTLSDGFGVDSNEAMINVTPDALASTSSAFDVAASSDLVKRFAFFDSTTGALADSEFHFSIERLRLL